MWETQEIIIRGTPAQFAALAYHMSRQWLNSLERITDPFFVGRRFAGRMLCRKGLFYVYDWPLPGDAPAVTVRINADGGAGIDQEKRRQSTAYGWIDARSLPDLPGKGAETLLVVELPPLVDTNAMVIRHVWDILTQAMIDDAFIDDDEEAPAVIGGGETGQTEDITLRRQKVMHLWAIRDPETTTTRFKDDAAEELSVSPWTIRDDLAFLRKEGQIE